MSSSDSSTSWDVVESSSYSSSSCGIAKISGKRKRRTARAKPRKRTKTLRCEENYMLAMPVSPVSNVLCNGALSTLPRELITRIIALFYTEGMPPIEVFETLIRFSGASRFYRRFIWDDLRFLLGHIANYNGRPWMAKALVSHLVDFRLSVGIGSLWCGVIRRWTETWRDLTMAIARHPCINADSSIVGDILPAVCVEMRNSNNEHALEVFCALGREQHGYSPEMVDLCLRVFDCVGQDNMASFSTMCVLLTSALAMPGTATAQRVIGHWPKSHLRETVVPVLSAIVNHFSGQQISKLAQLIPTRPDPRMTSYLFLDAASYGKVEAMRALCSVYKVRREYVLQGLSVRHGLLFLGISPEVIRFLGPSTEKNPYGVLNITWDDLEETWQGNLVERGRVRPSVAEAIVDTWGLPRAWLTL